MRRGFERLSETEVEHPRRSIFDATRGPERRGLLEHPPLPENLQKAIKDHLKDFTDDKEHKKIDSSTFTIDNKGQIFLNEGEIERPFSLKELKPDPKLEQEMKKFIIYQETGIEIEDLNRLKINQESFSYTDRNGMSQQISQAEFRGDEQTYNEVKQKIESQLTSWGIEINSKPVPDAVESAVKDHAIENGVGLKEQIENGAIIDYHYDRKNNEYKFYVLEEKRSSGEIRDGEIKDGEIKEVPFDLKKLPSEVRTDFQYQVEKHAVASELGSDLADVNQLRKVNDQYQFETMNGSKVTRDLDVKQSQTIKDYMSSLGFDSNKQNISDSVRTSVLEHVNTDEKDPAKKELLEHGGIVYYDQFDNNSNKHEFIIIPKEKTKDEAGRDVVKDKEAMKLSFSNDEYKAIMDVSELKAAKKYIQLKDDKKIADSEDAVEFDDPQNKARYRVKDTEGGEHVIPKDGSWKADIEKELNMKPEAKPDNLSEKTSDTLMGTAGPDSDVGQINNRLKGTRDSDTLVSTAGPDNDVDRYAKKLKRAERNLTWITRTLFTLDQSNNAMLQASQNTEQITSAMLGTTDNNQVPQMIQTVDQSLRESVSKHLKHKVETAKTQLKNAEKSQGRGSLEALASDSLKKVSKGNILKDSKAGNDQLNKESHDSEQHDKEELE